MPSFQQSLFLKKCFVYFKCYKILQKDWLLRTVYWGIFSYDESVGTEKTLLVLCYYNSFHNTDDDDNNVWVNNIMKLC